MSTKWLRASLILASLAIVGCKSGVSWEFDPAAAQAATTQPAAVMVQGVADIVPLPGAAAVGGLIVGAIALFSGFKKKAVIK